MKSKIFSSVISLMQDEKFDDASNELNTIFVNSNNKHELSLFNYLYDLINRSKSIPVSKFTNQRQSLSSNFLSDKDNSDNNLLEYHLFNVGLYRLLISIQSVLADSKMVSHDNVFKKVENLEILLRSLFNERNFFIFTRVCKEINKIIGEDLSLNRLVSDFICNEKLYEKSFNVLFGARQFFKIDKLEKVLDFYECPSTNYLIEEALTEQIIECIALKKETPHLIFYRGSTILNKILNKLFDVEYSFRFPFYKSFISSVSFNNFANNMPRVSLITSLFKGRDYLDSFIFNLKCVNNFESIEVLIFDAGPDFSDFEILHHFLLENKNVRYFKLISDPGLYEIWNLGVHLAKSNFIGNANLDDRRHPLQVDLLLDELNKSDDIDIVSTHIVPTQKFDQNYADYVTNTPHVYYSWMKGKYGLMDLFKINESVVESNCIPHCMPIWRKSLHKRFGFFNEKKYKSAADYAFWIRSLSQGASGSIVPFPASYYYINPHSYMRVDGDHTNTPSKLYDEYIKSSSYDENYLPNFQKLKKLISFIIN